MIKKIIILMLITIHYKLNSTSEKYYKNNRKFLIKRNKLSGNNTKKDFLLKKHIEKELLSYLKSNLKSKN